MEEFIQLIVFLQRILHSKSMSSFPLSVAHGDFLLHNMKKLEFFLCHVVELGD